MRWDKYSWQSWKFKTVYVIHVIWSFWKLINVSIEIINSFCFIFILITCIGLVPNMLNSFIFNQFHSHRVEFKLYICVLCELGDSTESPPHKIMLSVPRVQMNSRTHIRQLTGRRIGRQGDLSCVYGFIYHKLALNNTLSKVNPRLILARVTHLCWNWGVYS